MPTSESNLVAFAESHRHWLAFGEWTTKCECMNPFMLRPRKSHLGFWYDGNCGGVLTHTTDRFNEAAPWA